MKKYLLLLAVALPCLIFTACSKEDDDIPGTGGVKPAVKTGNAVDLGLSVKWADRNVGASSPEDYGDYFAWGETEPKEVYNRSTYKWCKGSIKSQTKYCTDPYYGNNDFWDNKTTLDPDDDAATANWGSGWRMPTIVELGELTHKCTWVRTTQNGVYGCKVTGPNGNSIFLPASGYRSKSDLTDVGPYEDYYEVYYWASDLFSITPSNSPYYLGYGYWYIGNRDEGYSVRPVCQ